MSDLKNQDSINIYIQGGMLIFDLITFIALFFIPAHYGRLYDNKKTKLTLPNILGWIIQEIPNVFISLYYTYMHLNNQKYELIKLFMVGLFLLHYIHRTFIFPFKLVNSKKMPIEIVIMACIFVTLNSLMINRSIYLFSDYSDISYFYLFIGLGLFFLGMYINILHDYHIQNLRNKKEGYIIPNGYLFEYISCPNYLGEIIEWLGFALATQSFSGLVFAISTFSNLFPRALEYHKWYLNKFAGEYPKNRKAIIPFII